MSNMKTPVEPIRLSPAFKDYLWGGTRLKTEYNKQSSLPIVAESWELSVHPDGASTVADGEWQGLTFAEYVDKSGKAVLGTNAAAFDRFPILIKFIDAKQNLSVQVHPDDAYALKNEGEYGKTEVWYILDCEEGAGIYYGFSRDVTKEECAAAIREGRLTELLQWVPVKRGEAYLIPAGTVHAIGAGCLICEIQQNSNITYRVYDYDRRDKDGNPRQLHVEKALAVSNLEKKALPAPIPDGEDVEIASCRYFTVHRLRVSGKAERTVTAACFHSLLVTRGEGTLTMHGKTLTLNKGDSIFIPAQDAAYTLSGDCELILSYV